MKKVLLSFVLFFSIYSVTFSQSNFWSWAKNSSGTGNSSGSASIVDANGNCIITGEFRGTITFGNITLQNNGYEDVYVIKYDANGNVIWAKSAGGNGDDWGHCIGVDQSNNIYVGGYYMSSTITFGNITLSNSGDQDMFLAKYDTNGNVLWAKKFGGSNQEHALSLSISGFDCYVTGYFGSSSIAFGNFTLTNNGSANTTDIFIAKFDSSGNVKWAKSAGGTNSDDGTGIALSPEGNIIISGGFKSASFTFGNYTITNAASGYYDIFIAKYDSSGNVKWAKSAGGTSDEQWARIAVDSYGNSYITSYFRSPTLTIGNTQLVNKGMMDIYIASFDSIGNVRWAKSAGGANDEIGFNIVTSADGTCFVTGIFRSPKISFGNDTLVNSGVGNVFVAKLDVNGNNILAVKAGGTGVDEGDCLAMDLATGYCYVSGYSSSPTITFGNTTLNNSGSKFYVAKFNSATIPVEISEINISASITTVFLNWSTATETNNKGFAIYRDDNYLSFIDGKGSTTEKTNYNYEDLNVSIGRHEYRIVQHDFDGTTKEISKLNIYVSGEVNSFTLTQNYPNPFNPTTTFDYQLPINSNVKIAIYNSLGELVRTLIDEEKNAGYYSVLGMVSLSMDNQSQAEYIITKFKQGILFSPAR